MSLPLRESVGGWRKDQASGLPSLVGRRSFSTLTLLVGWQEGHPVYKKPAPFIAKDSFGRSTLLEVTSATTAQLNKKTAHAQFLCSYSGYAIAQKWIQWSMLDLLQTEQFFLSINTPNSCAKCTAPLTLAKPTINPVNQKASLKVASTTLATFLIHHEFSAGCYLVRVSNSSLLFWLWCSNWFSPNLTFISHQSLTLVWTIVPNM